MDKDVGAGWYDDPSDPTALRYWNGSEWTPSRQRKADPATPVSAAQAKSAGWPPPSGAPKLPPPQRGLVEPVRPSGGAGHFLQKGRQTWSALGRRSKLVVGGGAAIVVVVAVLLLSTTQGPSDSSLHGSAARSGSAPDNGSATDSGSAPNNGSATDSGSAPNNGQSLASFCAEYNRVGSPRSVSPSIRSRSRTKAVVTIRSARQA